METDKVTRVIGAVALAVAASSLVGLIVQGVTMAGWLGWLVPPQLFATVAFAIPNVLLGLAGLALVSDRWPGWRTVALAFVGVGGLLQVGVVSLWLQPFPPFGWEAWSIIRFGIESLGFLVGVVALVVLRRSAPERAEEPTANGAARAVALIGTVVIAVSFVFLPQFIDADGRGLGSAMSFVEGLAGDGGLDPRRLSVPLLVQLAMSFLVPLLAVLVVAVTRRAPVWFGAVAAVAAHYWFAAIQVVISWDPVANTQGGIGAYVVAVGFLILIAALTLERRADGGPAHAPSGPEDRDDRDRATVDA